MKFIDKKDAAGLALSAGVGVLVGLIYLIGKATGESNAYEDCNSMLKGLIDACKEVETK